MQWRCLVGLGCAWLVLLGASQALAQVNTADLAGTVRDRSGAVLPGATVTVRHVETGLVRSGVSDARGRFLMPSLPLGPHDVRVELAGFRPALRPLVGLVLGETAVVEVALELSGLSDELTVLGDVPLVNTRSGELSYLVGAETLRALPLNGRNYTDLALLQPGVVAYPHRDGGSVVAHGLGVSVNGQDPRSNVYLLDGTPMNDFTNGPAGSAAGTVLGSETIREFRVETNAYDAAFGRNSGGQVHVVTKSGSNARHGSAYTYVRNDALDARNFFDPATKPDFTRYQFGATLGGPLRRDRTFFFLGYEGLRENLGRSVSTVVPDLDARAGRLPDATAPGGLRSVPVDPAVRPYLDAFPVPNGPSLGAGLASYRFPFSQRIDQDYLQARLDQNVGAQDQFFVRYTRDTAEQRLPTDYPQFPRTFASRNHFLTAEYRHVASAATLHTLRFNFARTRVGQNVQDTSAAPLPAFVAGRPFVGNIDIGGLPRFGPQTSADVQLEQKILGLEYGLVHARGRHVWKAGALVERYVDDMSNPTFSLGVYTFPNIEAFLRNRPTRFLGLLPESDFRRNWRFTLFAGYLQDEFRVTPRLTLTGGLRYEYATLPVDQGGRDSSLIDRRDPAPTPGPLYQNPTGRNLSPRTGFAWDLSGDGRTALRGGYGLYFNTNNQQNLIVTVTNPPATPRVSIANPSFPSPPFARGLGNTIRPVQYDLDNPRVHVFNLGLQRELRPGLLASVAYAGSRGRHLLRSGDVNVPTPERLADGTLFYPANAVRPNPAFTTIEQKTSDGESWYNALVVELRRRRADGFDFQVAYTFSRNIDTTQASTFFSDATSGTTSAFPEPFGTQTNRGLADYHAKHNLVVNLTWDLPLARNARGLTRALLGGWQLAAIAQYRSGPPLTAFVQSNRSRSRWSPSLGPGLGFDRPDLAPGVSARDAVTGRPEQWFDPAAFRLQAAGTLGNLGRGALIGPDLKLVDAALVKRLAVPQLGAAGQLELRIEAFNLFNRVNLGIPSLVAFAGERDGEQPLPTFGRIRNTITSARQIQLGVRALF
jgi:hypothetical protein